jgi:malate permease and related proteins
MYRIFEILFPIFAIVLVGYLYSRYRPTDMSITNRIAIDIFAPALTFSVLSDKSFDPSHYQQLAIAAVGIVLGSGLLAWPVARWFSLNPKTIVPPMMFTNTGNMGIPVLLFAFGESALPAAVLLFVIATGLHFTVGTYILSHQARWWDILRLPMIQATVAGLLVSFIHFKVPDLLMKPIKMLGDCAIPLMLFSLGVRLGDVDLNYWKIGIGGAILRPLLGLLAFLLIRPWLELTPLQTHILLIFAILPPAVFNYILAEQYQQEPHQVAAIVMIGNLMSFITLPLALGFALR